MAEERKKLIEQFRPEKLPSGVPWRLFISATLIVLFVFLVYLGLSVGYGPYLESRINEIDQQLQQLSASISREDQEKFVVFYSQLANFNKILDKHILSSKLFPLLEKITNQKVFYTNMDLRVEERKLSLEGTAASYQFLAEQLASYDKEPAIESYILNQSQYGDGVVRFKVSLILKKEIFK